MKNSLKTEVSTVGHFRSKKSMIVPLVLEIDKIELFLKQYSLDELVDIFCVSEALVLKHKRQRFEGGEAKTVQNINSYLRARIDIEPLQGALNMLQLFTSLDYVRFGQDLCL